MLQNEHPGLPRGYGINFSFKIMEANLLLFCLNFSLKSLAMIQMEEDVTDFMSTQCFYKWLIHIYVLSNILTNTYIHKSILEA